MANLSDDVNIDIVWKKAPKHTRLGVMPLGELMHEEERTSRGELTLMDCGIVNKIFNGLHMDRAIKPWHFTRCTLHRTTIKTNHLPVALTKYLTRKGVIQKESLQGACDLCGTATIENIEGSRYTIRVG